MGPPSAQPGTAGVVGGWTPIDGATAATYTPEGRWLPGDGPTTPSSGTGGLQRRQICQRRTDRGSGCGGDIGRRVPENTRDRGPPWTIYELIYTLMERQHIDTL